MDTQSIQVKHQSSKFDSVRLFAAIILALLLNKLFKWVFFQKDVDRNTDGDSSQIRGLSESFLKILNSLISYPFAELATLLLPDKLESEVCKGLSDNFVFIN